MVSRYQRDSAFGGTAGSASPPLAISSVDVLRGIVRLGQFPDHPRRSVLHCRDANEGSYDTIRPRSDEQEIRSKSCDLSRKSQTKADWPYDTSVLVTFPGTTKYARS